MQKKILLQLDDFITNKYYTRSGEEGSYIYTLAEEFSESATYYSAVYGDIVPSFYNQLKNCCFC